MAAVKDSMFFWASFSHLILNQVNELFTNSENISKTTSLQNRKRKGAEILRKGSPSPTCHVSCVTCHISHFTCHVSYVTHKGQHIYIYIFFDIVGKLVGGGSVINGKTERLVFHQFKYKGIIQMLISLYLNTCILAYLCICVLMHL